MIQWSWWWLASWGGLWGHWPHNGDFWSCCWYNCKGGCSLQQGTDAVSRGKDLLGFDLKTPRWMDVVGHFWEYGAWMFRWCNLCGLDNMELAVFLRSSSWTVRTWGPGKTWLSFVAKFAECWEGRPDTGTKLLTRPCRCQSHRSSQRVSSHPPPSAPPGW